MEPKNVMGKNFLDDWKRARKRWERQCHSWGGPERPKLNPPETLLPTPPLPSIFVGSAHKRPYLLLVKQGQAPSWVRKILSWECWLEPNHHQVSSWDGSLLKTMFVPAAGCSDVPRPCPSQGLVSQPSPQSLDHPIAFLHLLFLSSRVHQNWFLFFTPCILAVHCPESLRD